MPGGRRLPLRRTYPVRSRHCPGCCGPRRSPVSASSARRQQATASSSLPSSFRTMPRLLCASAKSGFSSSRPAATGDRLIELALVLQGDGQVVVRLGERPASVPAPGGSRRSLRRACPGSLRTMPRLLCASAKFGFSCQRPAVRGGRFVEMALVLQRIAQVAVVPRHSRASIPVPGGSRQLLRRACPAPAWRCPGCCGPRQSRASVPAPAASRRPLRRACPGP